MKPYWNPKETLNETLENPKWNPTWNPKWNPECLKTLNLKKPEMKP